MTEEQKQYLEKNSEKRTKCEVWTRVMGYHRPISQWNDGKQSEAKERKYFTESKASEHLR